MKRSWVVVFVSLFVVGCTSSSGSEVTKTSGDPAAPSTTISTTTTTSTTESDVEGRSSIEDDEGGSTGSGLSFIQFTLAWDASLDRDAVPDLPRLESVVFDTYEIPEADSGSGQYPRVFTGWVDDRMALGGIPGPSSLTTLIYEFPDLVVDHSGAEELVFVAVISTITLDGDLGDDDLISYSESLGEVVNGPPGLPSHLMLGGISVLITKIDDPPRGDTALRITFSNVATTEAEARTEAELTNKAFVDALIAAS